MPESTQKSNKIGLAAGGLGALVLGAAQTRPEDAISNLAGWLELLGANNVPSFLATTQADNWGTAIGITLIASSGLWWLWKRQNRQGNQQTGIWLTGEGLDHVKVSAVGQTAKTRFFPLQQSKKSVDTSGRIGPSLRNHPDYIAESARQRAIDDAARYRKKTEMVTGLMGGFKSFADIADERKEDERQQKITQAELDRENRLALQKRRREVIADLRDIGLRYAHDNGEIPFREHLERQRPYVDIKRHLSKKYLSRLNAGRTSYSQADGALYPVLVQELFDELDRLERKWGL
jgi:LPXTG-motif cell wall-anchored protein